MNEPKEEKLTRRDRRLRWKAAKRQKRLEEKEYYRYAPFFKRLWNLYLKKPARVVLVLGIVAALLAANMHEIFESTVVPVLRTYYDHVKNQPLTEEKEKLIYEYAPLDEEGGKRIDALPALGEDETWTICVYFVAADLEDRNENDLSYVTSMLRREQMEEIQQNKISRMRGLLNRYNRELNAEGLELPAFFYYPDYPVAGEVSEQSEDNVIATMPGAASTDIGELTSGVWSDNIKIVMQTGGATRWSNSMVNPNRTQRFLYHNGEFSEVSNLQLQNASSPETLAEFMRFCKTEYPADHQMLILWNHGGGPFGYGMDSIFGNMFTLADIRSALESVYEPSSTDPAFDIIGFDACLMSCLEVTHCLDGFADYYCLSEESEPGDGWDYGPWLQAMTDNPGLSPAQVGREIADSYMNYYMRQNVNFPLISNEVTFSVLDAEKSRELYDAYAELAAAQMRDASENIGVLAEIGRCASRSTRYGGFAYNVMNTVDVGNYADYMSDSYPEECGKVRELVKDAVLYHRQNGALSDSTGIAVYIPAEVNTIDGLVYYLDYVYNISDSQDIAALYYYKQAGCLNDDLKEYVEELGYGGLKNLDISEFNAFRKEEPIIDSDGFSIPVSDNLQELVVGYELQIGCYDEAADAVTYYGTDRCLSLNGEGFMQDEFDGTWPCLDGQPLYIEVVSSTPAAVEYRAHVKYDGAEAYLMLSRDRDSDEFSIVGVRKVKDLGATNYLYSTRTNEQPKAGARIVPLYEQTRFSTMSTQTIEGKAVTFRVGTNVSMDKLPEGYYLMSAVISDQRGDRYYSNVIGADMGSSGISQWKADGRFYGSDW